MAKRKLWAEADMKLAMSHTQPRVDTPHLSSGQEHGVQMRQSAHLVATIQYQGVAVLQGDL